MMSETKNQKFDCNSCLFRNISCKLISKNDFGLLQRTSIQLHYKKGESVVKQGAKANHLVFLHKGIVKFSYQYHDGSNYIMTITKGPKLLGGANLFFKDINIFSINAIEECYICLIDSKVLRNIALKNPQYILSLCENTIDMFQHSIFNFISLAHNQVNGRIASILLYLYNHVYKDREYNFTISRKEIAEFAACSHENVITTLSKFNKEGFIELEGKKIIIKDMAGLSEISKRG